MFDIVVSQLLPLNCALFLPSPFPKATRTQYNTQQIAVLFICSKKSPVGQSDVDKEPHDPEG